MNFNDYIAIEGNYNDLTNYGMSVLYKTFGRSTLNQEEKSDIISKSFEELLGKNIEIGDSETFNSETFKRGYFAKYIYYVALNHLSDKHKKKLVFPEKAPDVGYKEYTPESTELLDKIKDKKLKSIIKDRFYNEMEMDKLKKKYKLSKMDTVYEQVRRDLNNKVSYQTRFVGVAKLKDGKIIKCYPSIRSVEKDGFVAGRVSALCKGKGNKKGLHKGFSWAYLKNLKHG